MPVEQCDGEALDRAPGGDKLRVFWIDAGDMLGYRVDDADSTTLWRRGDVTINDGLRIESFTRTNLERLHRKN